MAWDLLSTSMDDTRLLDVQKYMNAPRIRDLYSRVKERYAKAHIIAHGIDHIERDLINALVIGETEECRMPIVTAAILLHDIGFLYDPSSDKHNEVGAHRCAEWLEGWSESEKAEIAECIFRHKGVNEHWTTAPETIEQKIVCDADLLEKVGYIGVVQGLRVFIEFGASFEVGCVLYEEGPRAGGGAGRGGRSGRADGEDPPRGKLLYGGAAGPGGTDVSGGVTSPIAD